MTKQRNADHATAHSGRRDAEAVSSDEARLPDDGRRNPVKPQVEDADTERAEPKGGARP